MIKLSNLKVKQRITLAVTSVTVLASVSGIVSSLLLRQIQQEYDRGLERFGFAQGDAGMFIGEFAKLDGKIHDAISCIDVDIRQNAQNDMDALVKTVNEYLARVETSLETDEAKKKFQEASQAWQT